MAKKASSGVGSQLALLPVKKTTFTLPRELYTRLKIESAKRETEMSNLVTMALRQFFSEEGDR